MAEKRSRKLEIKKFPQRALTLTPDSRYWRSFKNEIATKRTGAVTCVGFSPADPHDLIITSGARIDIFDAADRTEKSKLVSSKENVHGASFRNDGRLVAHGDQSGAVRVIEIESKSVLRTFKEHTSETRVTRFIPNSTTVFSGSDDTKICVWDIPSESKVHKFEGHSDRIRAGSAFSDRADMFVTGGYDHIVKLWDLRANECVLSLDHGKPVESVLVSPTGNWVVSAGGSYIKVWDVVANRQIFFAGNHQKTITCLAADSKFTRVLSGSLDRQLKVYDANNFSVAHSFNYQAPILSVALSANEQDLAVGMADGVLSMKRRRIERVVGPAQPRKAKRIFYGTRRFFLRGKDLKAQKEDQEVKRVWQNHLSLYEKHLARFEWHLALDAAVETHDPRVITTMCEELELRGTLRNALSGRTESSLLQLLERIPRHITQRQYSETMITVANLILDIYSGEFATSPVLATKMKELRDTVKSTCTLQRQMVELSGMIDMIYSSLSQEVQDQEDEEEEEDLEGEDGEAEGMGSDAE